MELFVLYGAPEGHSLLMPLNTITLEQFVDKNAMAIQVKESFVSKEYQDTIEKTVIGKHFPLFYQTETCLYDESKPAYQERVDKNTKDSIQFTHMAVWNGEPDSKFWPLFLPLTFQAENLFNVRLQVVRCKVNATYPTVGFLDNQYNPPHKDQEDPNMMVGIYYVNDSDGDTLFFEEPASNFTTDEFKVVTKVSPKKGNFVLFPASVLHAGRPPIVAPSRYVINFNFKVL